MGREKKWTCDFEVQLGKIQNRQMTKYNSAQRFSHSVIKNTTATVIQFLLWCQQINCWMLKDVSRHCSSCVRNMSHIFFHVFLNNEKLPFILELSSNNQIYLRIINVIYSVPSNKQTIPFFFYCNMVFLSLCNRQPSFTAQGEVRSVHLVTVHDPLSYKWQYEEFQFTNSP